MWPIASPLRVQQPVLAGLQSGDFIDVESDPVLASSTPKPTPGEPVTAATLLDII